MSLPVYRGHPIDMISPVPGKRRIVLIGGRALLMEARRPVNRSGYYCKTAASVHWYEVSSHDTAEQAQAAHDNEAGQR